jgi:hypothetical protein
MWNLILESLLELFTKDDPVKVNGYADDAALICTGESMQQIYMRLQKALDKISGWSDKHGLTFCAAKSVTVCFTKKWERMCNKNKPKPLTLKGVDIAEEKHVRYLGVILDSKLSWRKHVEVKVQNAKMQLIKICNAMGKIWGAPPRMVQWAFTGIVRPAFTYGALVWAKISETTWAETKLKRLNRLALMSMGHFRKSTPTAGMEVINYIRPLTHQLKMEAAMGYLRTQHMHKNIKTSEHLVFAAKQLNGIELSRDTDEGKLSFNWNRKYQVLLDSFQVGEPDYRNNICVYTDGSLVKNNAGSGFYIERRWENDHIEGHSAL